MTVARQDIQLLGETYTAMKYSAEALVPVPSEMDGLSNLSYLRFPYLSFLFPSEPARRRGSIIILIYNHGTCEQNLGRYGTMRYETRIIEYRSWCTPLILEDALVILVSDFISYGGDVTQGYP